jgi:LmbE family N-acetylglucosaminyl deacetylase
LVAHPDDEAIGFGGALARARGHALAHVVVVTDGAPRDPALRSRAFRGTREAYARLRREELERALAEVGIGADRTTALGLVDQEAAYELFPLARALAERIARLRPRVIVTHAYEGGHPDHDAAAFAVAAARRLARSAAPLVEMAGYHAGGAPGGGPAFSVQRFLPSASRVEDGPLSPRLRAVKRRMMDAHATQREVLGMFRDDREPLRLAPPHDFASAPHAGPTHYERQGWAMTSRRFTELATAANEALGLDAAPLSG